MKIAFFFLLLFSCSIYGQNKNISLSGENFITLNGERFKNQKIIFSKADGDWYTTGKDGHGSIEFTAPYEGRNLIMHIEWDGSEEPHLVTDEIRHNGKRQAEFTVTMEDKNTYGDGLNAYTSGDDEIKISILKIADMNVTGQIAGIITQGNEKMKVDALFNLKKNAAPKKMVSSSYKDCDNVIHDKLIGAESRSPSECEAKYDLDVRTAIHDALTPVIENFMKQGWNIQEQTDLSPLFDVGRGSEKDIFNTSYDLKMQAGSNSDLLKSYKKDYDDVSEKLKSATKEAFDEFVKFSHKMNGSIYINIEISVNNHNSSVGNFKGGSKIIKLANNIYKVQSPYVQARTGGDANDAKDATFLFIGNWKQPTAENNGDGSEEIKATAVINPALSHLAAQNIIIRMECNTTLADEIIKNLDLQKLQSLLQ